VRLGHTYRFLAKLPLKTQKRQSTASSTAETNEAKAVEINLCAFTFAVDQSIDTTTRREFNKFKVIFSVKQ